MKPAELRAWRDQTGQSQATIAAMVGLSHRQYQELEAAGEEEMKARHVAALESASLRLAVKFQNLNFALPSIRPTALAYAQLFSGGQGDQAPGGGS